MKKDGGPEAAVCRFVGEAIRRRDQRWPPLPALDLPVCALAT